MVRPPRTVALFVEIQMDLLWLLIAVMIGGCFFCLVAVIIFAVNDFVDMIIDAIKDDNDL